mgnify:CR=1 FL=1
MLRKIVISGGWGYGNLGDEIIAKCTIDLLDRYFPNIQKIFTSYDIENFSRTHHLSALESVHSIFERNGYEIKDIGASIENPEAYGIDEFAGLFDRDTMFLMSGGGYFDGRWNNQFAARIVEMQLAQKAGAKTAIIGQSIGPLINAQEAVLLKNVLEFCDFVNVRDEDSKRLIADLLPHKKVSCTSDIAVMISDLLPAIREERNGICNLIVQIYTDYVPNGKKVHKNNTLYSKIRKRVLLRQYRYDFAWVRLLREIHNKTDYKMQIILNVQGTQKVGNAHFEKYAKKLIRLSHCDEIKIVQSTSIEDFCNKLANAETIISCKMHPLIISSSYGVRTYALSQHYKIDAYMKWIGRESACCRNNKIKPKKLIDQLLNEDLELQLRSNRAIQARKQEVCDMFEKLSELIL